MNRFLLYLGTKFFYAESILEEEIYHAFLWKKFVLSVEVLFLANHRRGILAAPKIEINTCITALRWEWGGGGGLIIWNVMKVKGGIKYNVYTIVMPIVAYFLVDYCYFFIHGVNTMYMKSALTFCQPYIFNFVAI